MDEATFMQTFQIIDQLQTDLDHCFPSKSFVFGQTKHLFETRSEGIHNDEVDSSFTLPRVNQSH